jgi:hypothetical protein
MDVEWIEAPYPAGVVGITAEGGLFVHASLHPLGVEAALVSAKAAGIAQQRYDGETYFPLPWVRSEVAAAIEVLPAHATASLLRRIRRALDAALPALQRRAEGARAAGQL